MYVHGDNLAQKESGKKKYSDGESADYLTEIRKEYDLWKHKNIELKGPFPEKSEDDEKIIEERTKLFSDYKDFIDQKKYAEKFDSR